MNMNRFKQFVKFTLYLIIATSTILLNKWLYVKENTPIITLTLTQFFWVFIGLFICEKRNIFNIKSVHVDLIIFPASLFCCLVIFMNLSLSYNSLATYQISKTMITPIIVFLQFILYKQKQTFITYTVLAIIIIGSGFVFYHDSHFDLDGLTFLIIAVTITVLYEIILKKRQSELQLNKLQLLYYYAPFSTIFVGVCLPIIEPPREIFFRDWTVRELFFIVLSCLLAILNNLMAHWITANTTILNCTILLQIKLFLILTSSWFLYEEVLNDKQLIGLGINITSCLIYAFIKTKNNRRADQYKQII